MLDILDIPTLHTTKLLSILSILSMLRPWLGSGTLRSLCVRLNRSLPARNAFSSSTRYLEPPASADRVPLRKQLKQEAKALRSHKRQRKETAQASRQEWELTVGVEIHAQLDTETKLFSRTPHNFPCASYTNHLFYTNE
jgi:aspartyl-tRNA(Asn)/glutamyl-tRNA(Gln) amidotransferase subunit B